MRTMTWWFLVSVLLFVSGIGFVIAAARTTRTAAAAPAAAAGPTTAPVATVKQLMTGIVAPASQAVWGSVSTLVSERGIEEKQPQTDQEWDAVAAGAAAMAESANLLMMSPRAVDQGDWMAMAKEFADTSTLAMKAAQAKQPEEVLATGEKIYNACTKCHERYQRQ